MFSTQIDNKTHTTLYIFIKFAMFFVALESCEGVKYKKTIRGDKVDNN